MSEYQVTVHGSDNRIGTFLEQLKRSKLEGAPGQALRQAAETAQVTTRQAVLTIRHPEAQALADKLAFAAREAWMLNADTAASEVGRAAPASADVPVLVIVRNGIVDETVAARDGQELELLFDAAVSARTGGRRPETADLDNGYAELADGTVVAMSWAQPSEDSRLYAQAKQRAVEMGFAVRPDPDQPHRFYFADPHGNGSEISFDSEQEAWDRIVAELPSYEEVETENAAGGQSPMHHPLFKVVMAFFRQRYGEDLDGTKDADEAIEDMARRAAYFVCASESAIERVLSEAETFPAPTRSPAP